MVAGEHNLLIPFFNVVQVPMPTHRSIGGHDALVYSCTACFFRGFFLGFRVFSVHLQYYCNSRLITCCSSWVVSYLWVFHNLPYLVRG